MNKFVCQNSAPSVDLTEKITNFLFEKNILLFRNYIIDSKNRKGFYNVLK